MGTRNEQLSTLLQEHIDAGEFPSAVYLVADRGQIVYAGRARSFGRRALSPRKQDRHNLRSRFTHKTADHRFALFAQN